MRSPRRLLLIEDDANAREGYRALLSMSGFHVDALDGGIDAVEVASTDGPDLIVLDLGLPDVDGWEVARRLKATDATKDIPIIAFSGYSLHHEQISALRAGCDVYLTKPCPPDRLLSAIRKLLKLDKS